MRYTVTKQRIDVLGYIWMPRALCAQSQDLSASDLENIGNVRDRAAVERWVDTHCGDFSSIQDFRADFHVGDEHIVHEWANGEASEVAFADCVLR
jgi:hypothetical protein